MDDDLVQFLRARLDEDEAVARRACEYAEAEWRLDDEFGETILWWPPEPRIAEKEREHGLQVVSDQWRGQTIESSGQWIAPHIARHDPARVLAEVEAKRRRLDTYEAACRRRDAEQQDFVDWAGGDARADRPSFAGPDPALIPGLEYAIRQDARVYRDHPDFDPSWLEN